MFSYENNRFSWSEWRDSNSRHPGPKPGALPTGPHPDIYFFLLRKVVKHVVKFHFLPPRAGSKLEFPLVPQQFFCARGRLRTSRAPAPKAGALPTALHPDIKLWGGLGVFSQTTRATNCANPGYSVFLHDTMRRRKKQVFRVCGQRCGQARFCGSFSTDGFPPQATVPRASGLSLSGERIGRLSSQSRRAINCATSGYLRRSCVRSMEHRFQRKNLPK